MICRFKATIPESKIFFRVYDVKAETTLYALYSFLIDDLDFTPDQMVCFEAFDKNGKMRSQYALFDLGDGSMDKVTLADVLAKEEETLHFVYDLRNGRHIILVFEGETEAMKGIKYPWKADEKGVNPDQFSAKYEDQEPVTITPKKRAVIDDEDFDDDDEDLDDDDEDLDDDEDEEEGEELLVDEDFGK